MKARIWMAALAVLALGGTALAQGDVITQRREGLKRMNTHMEAMKPVSDARGDVRTLVPRLDDMIAFYSTMPALFPAGSGTGDTKARPEIWANFADFEAVNGRMVGQIRALKAAAEAGDAAAFATAFQATGPQFCGSCHRPYRAR